MRIMNQPQRLAIVFVTLLLSLCFAATAYAHGVVITYSLKANGEVELVAEFDTGEPMAEAQVTIYSPEDPLTPWLTGIADAEGRYVFVIDPEMSGIWDIQYRKAGHGDIVYLQLDEGMIDPALMDQGPGELLPTAPTAGTTTGQAETVTEVESGSDVMTLAEESKTPESTDHAAGDTEAETGGVAAAQTTTTTEAKQPTIDEMETETVPQPAPEAANQPGVTGEAAVLSSGGNVGSAGGFTSIQIMLMSASVIWGFVGTALYFSSKRTQDQEHAHDHHH